MRRYNLTKGSLFFGGQEDFDTLVLDTEGLDIAGIVVS